MTENTSKQNSKKRELTPEQRNFLDLLFGEAKGSVSKALKLSGLTYSPSQIIRVLGPEIRQLAEDVLAMNAPLASLSMIEALTDPNAAGTSNRVKAAQDVLDRVGITKKSEDSIKVSAGGGLVVLPAKEVDPDMLERLKRRNANEGQEDDEETSEGV